MPFHRRVESLVLALGRNLLARLLRIVPARAGHLSVKRGQLIAVIVFDVAYLADSANRNARIEGAHLSGAAAVAVARVNSPINAAAPEPLSQSRPVSDCRLLSCF